MSKRWIRRDDEGVHDEDIYFVSHMKTQLCASRSIAPRSTRSITPRLCGPYETQSITITLLSLWIGIRLLVPRRTDSRASRHSLRRRTIPPTPPYTAAIRRRGVNSGVEGNSNAGIDGGASLCSESVSKISRANAVVPNPARRTPFSNHFKGRLNHRHRCRCWHTIRMRNLASRDTDSRASRRGLRRWTFQRRRLRR